MCGVMGDAVVCECVRRKNIIECAWKKMLLLHSALAHIAAPWPRCTKPPKWDSY